MFSANWVFFCLFFKSKEMFKTSNRCLSEMLNKLRVGNNIIL